MKAHTRNRISTTIQLATYEMFGIKKSRIIEATDSSAENVSDEGAICGDEILKFAQFINVNVFAYKKFLFKLVIKRLDFL